MEESDNWRLVSSVFMIARVAHVSCHSLVIIFVGRDVLGDIERFSKMLCR